MPGWLIDSMASRGPQEAIAEARVVTTYGELVRQVAAWRDGALKDIEAGAVVAFDGDFSPASISLLLALAMNRCIAVPLSIDVAAHHEGFTALAEAEYVIHGSDPASEIARTGRTATHSHYQRLRDAAAPGLVLFSSGSTGAHKAAVHDVAKLMRKFQATRHGYRTIGFLQIDHIGGLNTLLYTLANGGTLVAAPSRAPGPVCAAIARHRVELLPTSPTFLNLLLLSEEHLHHDLSTLTLITYGTEPMPESTLRRVSDAFPSVRLLQTYGLSEIGILRSQSRSSDSLWVRVGGDGFITKVTDGRLWVRAESAMLGYLNAPSPFDEDGFFDTGDLVEVDGEWIRFVGRENDVINVGGSKVFPAEVESVLLDLDNVADASVRGEPSPITGQYVSATIKLVRPEPQEAFKRRMRLFCQQRLSAYKIPARIRFSDGPLHNERFKRRRVAS